jgi:bacterioferritin-associated ferredoxin
MKAYPFQHKNPTSGLTTASEGMELRDYFAAKVLQAQLSIPETIIAISTNKITVQNVCGSCYEWADAMMKARKGVPNE